MAYLADWLWVRVPLSDSFILLRIFQKLTLSGFCGAMTLISQFIFVPACFETVLSINLQQYFGIYLGTFPFFNFIFTGLHQGGGAVGQLFVKCSDENAICETKRVVSTELIFKSID